jgi:hypothetical protein
VDSNCTPNHNLVTRQITDPLQKLRIVDPSFQTSDKYLYSLNLGEMRIEDVISIENIKFSPKATKYPANLDTIPLNLVKKRKLI